MRKIIIGNTEIYQKIFGIEFLQEESLLHSNGFVSVRLDWRNKKNIDGFSDFKYVDLSFTMYGDQVIHGKRKYNCIATAAFDFNSEYIRDYKYEEDSLPPILISMATTNKKYDDETSEDYKLYNYEYTHFENTKYGLICWFAPKGWEDWDNATKFK